MRTAEEILADAVACAKHNAARRLPLMRAMVDDPEDGGRDLTDSGRARLYNSNVAALMDLENAERVASQ